VWPRPGPAPGTSQHSTMAAPATLPHLIARSAGAPARSAYAMRKDAFFTVGKDLRHPGFQPHPLINTKCCLILFEFATYLSRDPPRACAGHSSERPRFLTRDRAPRMPREKRFPGVRRVACTQALLLSHTCTACSLRASDDTVRHGVPRQRATGNRRLLLPPEPSWPSARTPAAPGRGH